MSEREERERERGSCRKKRWQPTTSTQNDKQKGMCAFCLVHMSLCFVYGGGSGLGPSEDARQRASERASEKGSKRERERARERASEREQERSRRGAADLEHLQFFMQAQLIVLPPAPLLPDIGVHIACTHIHPMSLVRVCGGGWRVACVCVCVCVCVWR